MRTKLYGLLVFGVLALAGCANVGSQVDSPKSVVNQECKADASSSLDTFVGSAIENGAAAGYTVVVKAAYKDAKAQAVGSKLGSGDLVFDTLVLLDANDATGREADNYMVILSDKGCVLGHAFMDRAMVDAATVG